MAVAPFTPGGDIIPGGPPPGGIIIPPIIGADAMAPGIPPMDRFFAERRLGGGAIIDDIASLGSLSSFSFAAESSSVFATVGGGARGLPTSAGSSPGNIHPKI